MPPAYASRPDSRAATNHARLLEAATEAFSRKGFHATTTRDITTAAGLSSAALYVHFPSKEELLFAIASEGHEDVLRAVRRAAAGSDGPANRLAAMTRELASYTAGNRQVARVLTYELEALTPRHAAAVRQLRQQVVWEVEDILAEGVRSGVFTAVEDPALAARMVLSPAVDLARWFDPEGPWTSAQVAEQVAVMALEFVGCTSDEQRLGA